MTKTTTLTPQTTEWYRKHITSMNIDVALRIKAIRRENTLRGLSEKCHVLFNKLWFPTINEIAGFILQEVACKTLGEDPESWDKEVTGRKLDRLTMEIVLETIIKRRVIIVKNEYTKLEITNHYPHAKKLVLTAREFALTAREFSDALLSDTLTHIDDAEDAE